MKYNIINPKVNVVDFGPFMKLKDGTEITPDDFVYGAAKITYKDVGALNELIELKKNDPEFAKEQIKKGLIKVAGAGHASMATTPGYWAFVEGDSSKFVDSVFTGAVFSSSLMPSGRRVPITKEAILIPQGIFDKGNGATRLYVKTSEKNIEIYKKMQEMGMPKQEASKIVQYGHRGGGFMFMPLETLIYFSKLSEKDPLAIPQEAKEIIKQFEEFTHEAGAGITYEARKAAPRTGNPNPNIFHFRKNLAQELMKEGNARFFSSEIINTFDLKSKERKSRIEDFLKYKDSIFKNLKSIKSNWKNVLGELENIVADFNNTISVTTLTNTPWRVWGEVKRHRTLSQNAESIYNAVQRANEAKINNENLVTEDVLSMPDFLRKNEEAKNLWVSAFHESLDAYFKLKETGIKESDAIAIIPRGIKLGVVKQFDLYNLTTGYSSLRLCSTAEPEMRKLTEIEMQLIKNSEEVGEDVKSLIGPKCHSAGFCPELSFGKSCGKVKEKVVEYNEKFHDNFKKEREDYINSKLDFELNEE